MFDLSQTKIWLFLQSCKREPIGPIVQGIERKFPKLQIRVRVAVGLQKSLIIGGFSFLQQF